MNLRGEPEVTYELMDNAFQEGKVIDEMMPPVRRFGGGNRADKKRSILDKLKRFFEKYFGIGKRPLRGE